MKTLFIAIVGHLFSAIVAEIKKPANWNTVRKLQNPFHLIHIIITVYQTGCFFVPTDSQLEGMKQYQWFTKLQ